MRGKFRVSLLIILVLSLAVAGCGHSGYDGDDSGLNGSITIAGSTSVQPFSEVLAEEFMAQYPGVKINVQGGGSSQGLEATRTGVAQIGASSRELKPEEKSFHEYLIARDGIVVIVNPANPVEDLTLEEVRLIFSGQIDNWKEIGGPDHEIILVSRESGSGTRDGFESLAMNKEPVSDKALIANSTGAIRTIVAGDRYAIGYVSLAVLDSSVKPLRVEGVAPTADNIRNGKYAISRPFIYVTREEPTGLVRSFIDFVLSDQGQSILTREGAVRVRP